MTSYSPFDCITVNNKPLEFEFQIPDTWLFQAFTAHDIWYTANVTLPGSSILRVLPRLKSLEE